MLIFGRRSDFWDRRGKASHTFALISLLALSLGRNTSGQDILHSLILHTLKRNNLLHVLLQYQISIKLVHPKLCFQSVQKPFSNDFFLVFFSPSYCCTIFTLSFKEQGKMVKKEISVFQQTQALLYKNFMKKWRMKRESLTVWFTIYIFPYLVNENLSCNIILPLLFYVHKFWGLVVLGVLIIFCKYCRIE